MASGATGAVEKQGATFAQANNPLSDMNGFSTQNYYTGKISGTDQDANQLWLRYAQAFSVGESRWVYRASLPVNTYPVPPGGGHRTGVGDFNVIASWLINTGTRGVSFGLGPQLTVPTASDDATGTEKWSAGLVNVLFNASSPRFQYGYLATWQHSFAGNDDRSNVNLGTFQTVMFYQLGGGTYLRASPIWAYNFHNNSYSVPLGLGVGQVIKKSKATFNIYVEPQWSVADRGPGQPKWQVLAGLGIQFF
jgi:hypothetical protein